MWVQGAEPRRGSDWPLRGDPGRVSGRAELPYRRCHPCRLSRCLRGLLLASVNAAPGSVGVLLLPGPCVRASSLAPHVYGDGVLCVRHAGDAGQRAREALPRVPGPRVSACCGPVRGSGPRSSRTLFHFLFRESAEAWWGPRARAGRWVGGGGGGHPADSLRGSAPNGSSQAPEITA